MRGNSFDPPAAILLSRDSLVLALTLHKVFERRNLTSRIGLVRVLCFAIGGRGRMPNTAQLLAGWSSEPTISLFEPPAQVNAFVTGGANASFNETRWHEAGSIAAGCQSPGHDISKRCDAIRQWLAQVVSINPR
jgi:hypothetical protein